MKFEIDNKLVDVEINRKKIKNLYIRVKDGKIIVSANTFTTDNYIKNLLESERIKIEQMLKKDNLKKITTAFCKKN